MPNEQKSPGLGERFFRLRDQAGLSQRAAADRVGVGLRQWQRWENNETTPYKSSLARVARAFSVPLAHFDADGPAFRAAAEKVWSRLNSREATESLQSALVAAAAAPDAGPVERLAGEAARATIAAIADVAVDGATWNTETHDAALFRAWQMFLLTRSLSGTRRAPIQPATLATLGELVGIVLRGVEAVEIIVTCSMNEDLHVRVRNRPDVVEEARQREIASDEDAFRRFLVGWQAELDDAERERDLERASRVRKEIEAVRVAREHLLRTEVAHLEPRLAEAHGRRSQALAAHIARLRTELEQLDETTFTVSGYLREQMAEQLEERATAARQSQPRDAPAPASRRGRRRQS